MGERDRHPARKQGKTTGQPVRPVRRPTPAPDAAGMTGVLLRLQRTIGNQAVEQLLQRQAAQHRQEATQARREQDPERRGQQVREAGGAPRVQRLMSYDAFKKATRQVRTRGGIRGAFGIKKTDRDRQDVLSGTTGRWALKTDRERKGLQDGSVEMDINAAYEKYQGNPSLATMIALYDRITIWQTLNAGYKWADDLRYVLETVKEQIEADVRAETEKQAGGKAPLPAGSIVGQGGRAAKGGAMAPFLREVGVPQGYYDEHLAGKQDAIDALEAFYTGLKEGHLADAARAYKKVSQLEGMYLIKPLFQSHFANQANLQDLVGSDAEATEGNELTPAELRAIQEYCGANFEVINTLLRGHVMQPTQGSGVGRLGRHRAQAVDGMQPKTQQARKQRQEFQHAGEARANVSLVQAAVSGLNKLPKFQGIAYRVLIRTPSDFFAAVRPGGVMSDLGFISASPSMTGVGNYAASSMILGSKSVYFIIHAKSAAFIAGLAAKDPKEGEVLFRPGTRFAVRAVWEHVNGKVPPNAPAQAQMVLHAMGEYKTAAGLTQAQWKSQQEQNAKAYDARDPRQAEAIRAKTFSDERLDKVKVVEVTEV